MAPRSKWLPPGKPEPDPVADVLRTGREARRQIATERTADWRQRQAEEEGRTIRRVRSLEQRLEEARAALEATTAPGPRERARITVEGLERRLGLRED